MSIVKLGRNDNPNNIFNVYKYGNNPLQTRIYVSVKGFEIILNPEYIVFDSLDILAEIRYSVKSFLSILSGFDRWEEKCGEEWREVEISLDDDENYYICARYNNSHHIPLPILENWYTNKNRLQKISIKLAKRARKLYEIGRRLDFTPTHWVWGEDDGWFHIGPLSIYYK